MNKICLYCSDLIPEDRIDKYDSCCEVCELRLRGYLGGKED